MNFVTASRSMLKRSKWVIANFVETTRASTDDVLKGYNRLRAPKYREEVSRNEHSYTNANNSSREPEREKVPRDVFGATILPSNLSFSNMKKLSMNQVKLEEIPFIDEGDSAEGVFEKRKKAITAPRSEIVKSKKNRQGADSGCLFVPVANKYLEFQQTYPFEEIPGPRVLENLSSTVQCTARLITVYFIRRLLQSGSFGPFRKYGPIVRLPEIMGGKMLLVNRAEDMVAVCEQDKHHPSSSSVDALECSRIRRHGKSTQDDSVSLVDWYEGKKAVDKALARDQERCFDGLEENGSQLVKRIKSLKNAENKVSSDFITSVNHWSLECLFQMLFDKSCGFFDLDNAELQSKNAKLLLALNKATRNLNMCEDGLQVWRLTKTISSASLDNSCDVIESFLSHYICEAQMNLLGRHEHSKCETFTLAEGMLRIQGMTKADVITHHLDTLLIGMNSITNALVFLLYHLARNPRSQEKLLREIQRVLPEKYSRLEYDHLNSLKYLEACLKESLRLNMPMPILTKHLRNDVVLSNFQVPRGTLVLMPAQLEALQEENFEGAREFRPGRWLDSETTRTTTHPFACLPLSSYPRHCFETRQAEISVMVCVAQIIRNFTVRFDNGVLNATNSTISYPITPLTFTFLDRED